MNTLPFELLPPIISFAISGLEVTGVTAKAVELHNYAQVNKHWYSASLEAMKADTMDYSVRLLEKMKECSFFTTCPLITQWKISIITPSFNSTMKGFSTEIEQKFNPLKELEPSQVDEIIKAVKIVSFGLKHVYIFGNVINKNLNQLQKVAIFKEIASILPSSYPSDNAEILIKACARLNYLGYIEDAVEIAKTMLCNKGKKIAMAVHVQGYCKNLIT